MTFPIYVQGKTGWIVFDPVILAERDVGEIDALFIIGTCAALARY
jgi:hypothetical protein